MSKKENAGIFQLENGHWGYRFIVKCDGRRKAQKRVRDESGNPFLTKEQAAAARKDAIMIEKRKLLGGEPAKPVRKRLCEIYEEYCESGRLDKEYSTKKKHDCLWNNHIKARFGDRYADDISSGEINDYLAELRYVNNYSYGYIESFLKLFYLIFGQAYSRNYLSSEKYSRLCVYKNGKIKMPVKKSVDVKDIVTYSKQEMEKMDEYFKGKNVETAYMIGKFAGLRSAECYGLTWDCINFKDGTMRINKQMKTEDGLIKLKSLKTVNSKRKIYMHKALRDYLYELSQKTKEYEVTFAAQRAQNEKMILDADGTKRSSLELINTLPNGKIQTEWAIKHHYKPLKELYDIDFRYHNLRHTYATNLAMLNIPLHILKNQMGHSKVSTTYKYYIGLSIDGVDIFKEKLSEI